MTANRTVHLDRFLGLLIACEQAVVGWLSFCVRSLVKNSRIAILRASSDLEKRRGGERRGAEPSNPPLKCRHCD